MFFHSQVSDGWGTKGGGEVRGMTFWLGWVVAILFCGSVVPAVAQPQPSVTIDAPGEALLGDRFTFTVTFENTGDQPGYGPYIVLCLPVLGEDGDDQGGPCDGIRFVPPSSVNFTGQSLQVDPANPAGQSLVLPAGQTVSCTNLGVLGDHPLCAGSDVPALPADSDGCQMVVLSLPFGSYFPDQPPIEIQITVDLSDHADLGVPLDLSVQGGFELDAAGEEICEAGGWEQTQTTPALVRLSKAYQGPENETATGPNFPRRYCLRVEIAAGQVIAPLTVQDALPDNLVYLGPYDPPVASAPPAGVAGGVLELDFGAVDADLTPVKEFCFDFFVPDLDKDANPVLTPDACRAPALDVATADGAWTPLDTRDPSNQTVDGGPVSHQLTGKCLAVQKGGVIADDVGGSGATPDDRLEFDVVFQVSDYFQLGDLVLEDVLSDGLEFLDTPRPTLEVTDKNGVTQGEFVPAEWTAVRAGCGDGSETVTFQVSAAMQRLATQSFHDQGLLTGGEVPPVPPSQAAIGRITYSARILDQFVCPVPSGDPSVDKHDTLGNRVVLDAEVWDPVAGQGSGYRTADDSAAGVEVAGEQARKEVYARNGDPDDPILNEDPPRFGPGDTVTFRIVYTLPATDAEELQLEDFLPDPAFDAGDLVTTPADLDKCSVVGNPPPERFACIGPADTLTDFLGSPQRPGPCPQNDPGTFVHDDANSLCFFYGDFDDPDNQPRTIEILFTVPFTDDPFSDQLLLTNEIFELEENSQEVPVPQTGITQVELGQPVVGVRKGAVAACCAQDPPACGAAGDFSPEPSVDFSVPGGGCPRFNGAIASSGGINSDLLGHVQRGDRVTFALVVENLGASPNGAFDVVVKDTLPAGFSTPAAGLGLCVTDGTGKSLDCEDPDGIAVACSSVADDLFGDGLVLSDPGPRTGALAPGMPASPAGSNLAVITYDLELDDDVEVGQCFTNTATLASYAGTEGGASHVEAGLGGPHADGATVCVRPRIEKSQIATSETHTQLNDAGEPVTIGEIVRYRVEVQLPEGVAPAFELRDLLPAGMSYLDDGSAKIALVSSTGSGVTASHLSGPNLSVVGDESNVASIVPAFPFPSIHVLAGPIFQLGDVENTESDCNDEFVVLELNALVDNVAANQQGRRLVDRFEVWIDGTRAGTSNPVEVFVVEPELTLLKELRQLAGNRATFGLKLTNEGNADAFEVELEDLLPSGMTLDSVTCPVATAECPAADLTCTSSAGNRVEILIASLEAKKCVEIEVEVTLRDDADCLNTRNQARVEWTSLPGPRGTASNPTGSQTPMPSGAVDGERDGSGGVNDYVRQSAEVTTLECPDLSITKTHTGEVTAGNEVVYTFAVTNRGGGAAKGPIVFPDVLPPGLEYVSSSGTGWTCVPAGAAVRCEYTDVPLAAGTSAPDLELTVRVDEEAKLVTANCVELALGDDANPQDNTACDVACNPRVYAYTTVDEFEQGIAGTVKPPHFQNVAARPSDASTSIPLPSGQLELEGPFSTYPFLWVAASKRGTIVRIHTETGAIEGEFLSSPDGMGRNPSRTTVEPSGSVWVTNRAEASVSGGARKGSVTRVGVLFGDNLQRFRREPNGSFVLDPQGEYVLRSSADYTTCDDRDNDLYIRTSVGLGNILPWDNAGGVDTDGGVTTAVDECIIDYVRVAGTTARTVAVDGFDGGVWVGGFNLSGDDFKHEKLSAAGQSVALFAPECGGYGGLVDSNRVLWSARGAREKNGTHSDQDRQILRYDTVTGQARCIDLSHNYGLGLDSDGNVWVSRFVVPAQVVKLDPQGNELGRFPTGRLPRGVVVNNFTNPESVWTANSGSNNVTRLDTAGNLEATIPVGSNPTGIAVDAAGHVWVTNQRSNNAQRINRTSNAVDLTVDLGADAGPYNYSDMTGYIAINHPQQGEWIVEQDSRRPGREWCRVCWNREKPQPKIGEATIRVEFKAADDLSALLSAPWVEVPNCVDISSLGLAGRYFSLRVRMLLTDPDDPPIVTDLAVESCCRELVCEEGAAKATVGGLIYPGFDCDPAIDAAEAEESLTSFHYREACQRDFGGDFPDAVTASQAIECRENASGATVDVEVCCPLPPCPDPADPEVHYLSQDPALCAIIRFSCGEGQTGFGNRCGCGCIGPPDIGVEKSLDARMIDGEWKMVFVLTVTNRGLGDLEGGFEVTDNLPPGYDYVSAIAPDEVVCSNPQGSEVRCTHDGTPPLRTGESLEIEIVVELDRPAFTDLENCAGLASSIDGNPDNDSACLALRCPVSSDFGVHYTGRTIEECAAVAGNCRDDQDPFWSACGCGCIDRPVPPNDCGVFPFWRVGAFGAWADPSGEGRFSGGEGDFRIATRTSLDAGAGFGLALERRLSRRFGLELAAIFTEPELEAERTFLTTGQEPRTVRDSDRVSFLPVTLGLDVHFDLSRRTALYVGPLLGYAFFDDANLFEGSGRLDDGIAYGGKLALDYQLGDRWSLATGLRWLRTETRLDGQPLDFDWAIWEVGIRYCF